MSLTGFNRLRRMKQEEAMKPENIKQEEIVEEVKIEAPVEPQTVLVEEKPIEEAKEEVKSTPRRRTTRRN